MNKKEAIQEACSIVYLAWNSIGDFAIPCDCFCSECKDIVPKENNKFKIADKATFDYVREAVKEKLIKDGFTVKE